MSSPIPDYGWSSVSMTSNSPALISETTNLRRHRRAIPTHRWEFEFTTPPLNSDEQRNFFGYLVALRGQIGSFTFVHPIYSTPRGRVPETGVVVNDDGKAGEMEISLSGLPENMSDVYKIGDPISFTGGDESAKVYTVAEDSGSASPGGVVVVKLAQPIVKLVAKGSAVVTRNVPFSLSLTDDQVSTEIDGDSSGRLVEYTIEAVEDY